MSSFKSALDEGRAVARHEVIKYECPEEFILEAMASNPYKSEKSRQAYIEGVSEWVNFVGRQRTRRMNGEA